MDLSASKTDKMLIVCGCVAKHQAFLEELGLQWNNKRRHYSAPLASEVIKMADVIDSLSKNGVKLSLDLQEYYTIKEKPRTDYYDQDGLTFKAGVDPIAPHQVRLIKMILNMKHAIVGLDTGGGKTRVSIDSVRLLGAKKILVVAPVSILVNFGIEFEKWSNYKVKIIKQNMSASTRMTTITNGDYDVLIINYDKLKFTDKKETNIAGAIKRIKWDAVIFDEADKLKSISSQRSKASLDIAKRIPIRIGLTATLTANGEAQAFMPCRVINSDVFGNRYWSFVDYYFKRGGYQDKEIMGLSEHKKEEFMNNLSKICIDVDPSEYQKNMAVPVDVPLYLDMDANLRKEYERVKRQGLISPDTFSNSFETITKAQSRSILNQLMKGRVVCGRMRDDQDRLIGVKGAIHMDVLDNSFSSAMYLDDETVHLSDQVDEVLRSFRLMRGSELSVYAMGQMHKLRQLSAQSESRKNALIEYLSSLAGKKVIIWACYTQTIDCLSDILGSKGYSYDIIDGRHTDRQGTVDRFQNEKSPQVLIWQISMSEGLNAPIARNVYFYELSFSFREIKQAKGRSRRLKGSEGGRVVYNYPLTINSIDSHIYDVINKRSMNESDVKRYILNKIYGGGFE